MKHIIITLCCIGLFTSAHAQQLALIKELSAANASKNASSEVVVQGDGRMMISVQDGKTTVRDVLNGSVNVYENKITNPHVACDYDFSVFVVIGNSAFDFVGRETKTGVKKWNLLNSKGDARAIAINPTNDDVIIGYATGEIREWWNEGKIVKTLSQSFSAAVVNIAVSDDGKTIVAVDETGKIEIISKNGKKSISGSFPEIVGLTISNEKNKILAISKNGSLKIWDTEGNSITGATISAKFIARATFSKDGKYAFVGTEMGKLLVYDIAAQQEKSQFAAHAEQINSLAMTDDGRMLASLSADGSLSTWSTSDLAIAPRSAIARQGKPNLTFGALSVVDANKNGSVEKGEKVSLHFMLENRGSYQTDSVIIEPNVKTETTGLTAEKRIVFEHIQAKKMIDVTIPINTEQISVGVHEILVDIRESYLGKSTLKTTITTENNSGNYLMVKDWWLESPSNKVEKNIPVSLKLMMYNPTPMPIANASLTFNLPAGLMPINRIQESLSLAAGDSSIITTQFLIQKTSTDTVFTIGIGVLGVNYSNASDIAPRVTLNTSLKARPVASKPAPKTQTETVTMAVSVSKTTTTTETTDSVVAPVEEKSYRGDPLAGIDMSTAKKEMEIGNYYALIIGVDNYKSPWTPLKNAVRDAMSVEKVLRSTYRFDHFKVLYNENATRNNVISEFEWLVANVKPKDNVFIYYSGHGDYKKDLNKGFWVPSDAASLSTSHFISNSDIQTFLGGIKSKHTLLVSDACFSGDIFRGTTESVKFEDSDKYYKKVYELQSRQAISSGGIEPVLDGGSEGHSIFAYYLLKVLQGNKGKYLDASQLYSKIKTPVVNNSEQDPQFAPIKNTGDEGGQFLFIRK